jgi:hypothetical protein
MLVFSCIGLVFVYVAYEAFLGPAKPKQRQVAQAQNKPASIAPKPVAESSQQRKNERPGVSIKPRKDNVLIDKSAEEEKARQKAEQDEKDEKERIKLAQEQIERSTYAEALFSKLDISDSVIVLSPALKKLGITVEFRGPHIEEARQFIAKKEWLSIMNWLALQKQPMFDSFPDKYKINELYGYPLSERHPCSP